MSDYEIRLDQFLKFIGFVETGGEAKSRIREAEVRVNGETETRRSRKLSEGDFVELGGRGIKVTEPEPLE